MAYTPIQDDIELLYQRKTDIYIKILLLNKSLKIVDSLDGELMDDSYTIDADSDIRRTFNLTMYVKDSSFLVGKNNKIWIDKYIQIFVGYKSQRTDSISYYPMGVYVFNDVGYAYNSSSKTLTLSCVDLMAQFTGLRNGQVMGLTTEIPDGSNIRQAIIETLVNFGKYTKYRIDSRNNQTDYINLFDIEATTNIYYNCSNDGYNNLAIEIPVGESYASIKYYRASSMSPNTTYTLSFSTTNTITNIKPEIIIYGKRTDSATYQTIIGTNNSKILSFTIDSAFTSISYMEIRIATLASNVTTALSLLYTDLAIYSGIYTVETLPDFVDYDRNQIVPYDLKFSTGSTIYDIIKALNELSSGWEIFLDTDATFINQKIPTTENDSYILDYEILDNLMIQEDLSTSFSDVKNSTRIWGKCIDSDRTIETCTNSSSEYQVVVNYLLPSGADDIPYGTTIAIKTNVDNLNKMKLKVTDNYANPQTSGTTTTYSTFTASYPIVDSSGTNITAGKMLANDYYVLKYRNKKFYLLGQFQVLYVVKEYNELPLLEGQTKEQWIALDKIAEGTNNVKYIINSESDLINENTTDAEKDKIYNQFAIDAIGEIRQVLSGGDYDLITTDDLARQRAEYENWKSMRLSIKLSLEIKAIPWLDVNQKIQYKSKVTDEIDEYIIKSINGSMKSDIMTVEAVKFYPLYPFIVE